MTLLQALKQLRDMAPNVPDNALGICHNLIAVGYNDTLILKTLWEDWEDYSGDRRYPVLGLEAFMGNENLWTGEQLTLRLSLINHMINKLENV